MAVYTTTDVIDNSIFLKSKLSTNMVGDNYYIENLQHKRDQDWYLRYNVVNIEEEPHKQLTYSQEPPEYVPIEVAIRNVKNIKGEAQGMDWANLAFRDLKHPITEGQRFRFSLDFPDMSSMSEVQKHECTSIWICVNTTPVKAGRECVVRRCNTTLSFLGTTKKGTTGQYDPANIVEIHQEPIILESGLQGVQTASNKILNVPDSEWRATMQLNYYTNQIKIDDRFIFGTVDTEHRDNNQVYKVIAVVKANTENTFVQNGLDELRQTPTVTLAFEKDTIGPDDDLENRIASNTTLYSVPLEALEDDEFTPGETVLDPVVDTVLLGESKTYTVLDTPSETFEFTYSLTNIVQTNWPKYFNFVTVSGNSFTVQNLKACKTGKLIVTATYEGYDSTTTKVFTLTLGTFY